MCLLPTCIYFFPWDELRQQVSQQQPYDEEAASITEGQGDHRDVELDTAESLNPPNCLLMNKLHLLKPLYIFIVCYVWYNIIYNEYIYTHFHSKPSQINSHLTVVFSSIKNFIWKSRFTIYRHKERKITWMVANSDLGNSLFFDKKHCTFDNSPWLIPLLCLRLTIKKNKSWHYLLCLKSDGSAGGNPCSGLRP